MSTRLVLMKGCPGVGFYYDGQSMRMKPASVALHLAQLLAISSPKQYVTSKASCNIDFRSCLHCIESPAGGQVEVLQ